MNSKVKEDIVFFRTRPEICRTLSEMLDRNVYGLNTANDKCVNRVATFKHEVSDQHICEMIYYFIRGLEKISVGLLSYSINEKLDADGKSYYKLKVCGELE